MCSFIGGGGGFLVSFGGLCFFCLSRNCSGGSIIRSLYSLTLFRGSDPSCFGGDTIEFSNSLACPFCSCFNISCDLLSFLRFFLLIFILYELVFKSLLSKVVI